ncbi:MAG: hypothetical protein EOM22_16525 [Gammaproteobacteria bacterium]|nr:hypothetical protein [Sphingobacteriia bacterium]NCC29694.1 hypothetical protein [Gammaproteobacteria bacterium]
MSMTGPMGVPRFTHLAMGADDRDDNVVGPDLFAKHRTAIDAAIQAREAAILAEVQAQRDATAQGRKNTLMRVRAADASRRILAQVQGARTNAS